MDETLTELLSRHLDGDLSPDEERELEARLETDPSLVAHLESLERVRAAVAALAAREKPPTEIDSVVDPLRRERPGPLVFRPWARWLTAAAVIVLGLSVIIEINRRNPGPRGSAVNRVADRRQVKPPERVIPAPLSSRSVPADEQDAASGDSLATGAIPESASEEPQPREGFGPVEKETGIEIAQSGAAANGEVARDTSSMTIDTDVQTGHTEDVDALTAVRDGVLPTGRAKRGEANERDRSPAPPTWEDIPRGRARLFVFIDGESAWREFTPSVRCKTGRYTVRIVVANGVVLQARPVGGAVSASPSQRLCAAELVRGLKIEEVADGEYPAEVVVEPDVVGGN